MDDDTAPPGDAAQPDDCAPAEVEYLDLGSRGGGLLSRGRGSGARRRPPRWVWLLVAAALATVVSLVVVNTGHSHRAASTARSAVPTTAVLTQAPAGPPLDLPASVTVTDLGHPLLPGSNGWDLFGLSEGVVVRVELARGRVTTTRIPSLLSTGPVSFVPVDGEVLIRPIDVVPGYLVPDGQPAQPMPNSLADSGPIFAGPDAYHIWVQSGVTDNPSMVLTALSGSHADETIPLVTERNQPVAGDGAGYLLLQPSDGGLLDARPNGLHQITDGYFVAGGRTGWLVAECDASHECKRVLVNSATGARHVVDTVSDSNSPYGVISPTGSTAAMYDVGADGHLSLYLLDLATGARRPVAVDVDQLVTAGSLIWSPDGRLLLAVTSGGGVDVVTASTGHVTPLDADLPPLLQLAARSAS
ncbi:MAG TPA: hypothetical protein VGH01_10930 [Jatrophihabitantaceae bacterium]